MLLLAKVLSTLSLYLNAKQSNLYIADGKFSTKIYCTYMYIDMLLKHCSKCYRWWWNKNMYSEIVLQTYGMRVDDYFLIIALLFAF